MTKNMIAIGAVVALLFTSGMAEAALTYSIVDYPIYQTDTQTHLTDHVSGTIVADPGTGTIISASFTITGGGTSYTVASATVDPSFYVHISPTQITVTPSNPTNPLNFGNLRLSGVTGLSGSNSTAVLQWLTPGDPWIAGSMNWASYTGTVGNKGSGPLFTSDHGATPFTQGSANGSRDTIIVANVVPIPAAVWLLGSGLIGIVGLRRRFKK